MSQKKRAVVTGGAGFIGSHLVDALIEKGWQVDVIDNLCAGKKEHVNKKAKLYVADIRSYEDITPIVKGADYVFHLAALPRVQYSIDHPEETNEVNITGTLNVLTAAKEGGVKRFIYTSSGSVYGDQDVLPLHEELPVRPASPYGLQKYAGEAYTTLYAKLKDLPAVSLRYFNVYGPRLNVDGAYALVMGVFLKHKKEGKPLPITGDGEQTRDFTHVRDVVRANILAAEHPKLGHGEVFNIGSGNSISINALAKLFGGSVTHVPTRPEPRNTRADNALAKRLLGWGPQVHIRDGVDELLQEWGF